MAKGLYGLNLLPARKEGEPKLSYQIAQMRGTMGWGKGGGLKAARVKHQKTESDSLLHVVALAVVPQWIEHRPAEQRIAGSIPSQGTCLGCGPGP